MLDETDITIEKHIQSLPDYVRDAFKAAKPFEKIRKMAADFKLHIDQAETLEQGVLLVMIGLEAPDTFIDETSKSFGLTEEDSKKLVDRISLELFMPIREAMQRYMEELEEKEEPEQPEQQVRREEGEGKQTENVPMNSSTLFTRAPLTPPPPALTPKPIAPSAVNDALSSPQVSPAEKVTVGIAPAKTSYKVDPYLEPPV